MFIRRFPDRERFVALAGRSNVVPVCVEILADMETPVSLLAKFYRRQGPVFLLESVEGGEKWGRYSFLGISARTGIEVFRDAVRVTGGVRVESIAHNGDPLTVLKALLGRYHAAEMPELPRFWGGLVGYFTYEMVSFFERIPNRLPPEQPLAHFVIPEELLVFDNVRNTLLCIALAFIDGPQQAEAIYEEATGRLERLLARIATPLPQSRATEPERPAEFTADLSAPQYRQHVSTVKDHIRNGDIIQAVISQEFSAPAPEEILGLYRAQRFVNPSPYLFFMHLADMVLAGSSPETMVRLESGRAILRPIAGTRPRGASEQQDRELADELLRDEKERAEHLMLVDLGRNDLGRVARTGSVQVTDLMVVERYSHVMHLVSNIVCDLKPGHDAWDLLRATFPAGTLSGAPKVRAMQIIAEMEPGARGPYGGAVGYIAFNGNMDLAITIRTACVQGGKLTVRAGAGIVADSDPERERQETVNKAAAVRRALELMRPHTEKEALP
jgi:anthranilate synthase component I